MGFYFRKSLRVGPFRYNLSKSGVGVSVGVKGFRVGSGPRGNYVHMGRGGVYYRKTLNGSSGQEVSASRVPLERFGDSNLEPVAIPDGTVGAFQDIDSGSVANMTSASSAGLLQEIKERHEKMRLFPASLVCSAIVLLLILWGGLPFLPSS